ncbi:hypothetical protein [Cobetia sp. ICG0124]|uniref:hypothetical protein n=1 Tax=Cobetia sp. ICG0124 TaxID=2053669 RepID=UPI000FDABC98|nr:hypothetical protein [Cobetia sp. ICG0124]AZV30941.1 hypothetical protein CU110_05530 [Cobetia sp. ICG0124]
MPKLNPDHPRARNLTPQRVSVLAGLAIVMVANIPRFLLSGDTTRLMLISGFAVAVAALGVYIYRQLSDVAQGEVPRLMRRVFVWLVVGLAAMAAFNFAAPMLDRPREGALEVLVDGLTLGLVAHVISLWMHRHLHSV